VRFLTLLVLSLAFLAMQSSLAQPATASLLIRPDFLLLLGVLWGLSLGVRQGLLAAALGGWLADSMSAGPFGVNTLAFMAAASLNLLRDRELVENRFALALALAPACTALYYGVTAAILGISGWAMDWAGMVANQVLPAMLTNTLATVPLYLIIALIAARFGMPYGAVLRRPGL
jgi:rod shape-determining protein MreD